MNILIAKDDGPEAEGLKVLQSATQTAYPKATIVTLSPKKPLGGLGLSVTPKNLDEFLVENMASQFYVVDAKPADLIYLALGQPERFLENGTFDLVLTGINHGENIGMDVFHSGTVGMAMLASMFFATPAVAFSKQSSESTMNVRTGSLQVSGNSSFIISFLKSEPHAASLCWNVNFPACIPRGWKVCSVAHHSRFRPFKSEERKHERCDVVELERGFVVVSPLCLNVAQPLNRSSIPSGNPLHWACDLDNVRLASFEKAKRTDEYSQ